MKKLWLIFAQTVITALAIVFVVQIFYPKILNSELQSIENNFHHSNRISSSGSYSVAAEKAMPSVVNIFTSKKKAINPHQQFLDDPVFKRFFGDQMEEPSQHDNSLGSGVIVNSDGLILTNQHVIKPQMKLRSP